MYCPESIFLIHWAKMSARYFSKLIIRRTLVISRRPHTQQHKLLAENTTLINLKITQATNVIADLAARLKGVCSIFFIASAQKLPSDLSDVFVNDLCPLVPLPSLGTMRSIDASSLFLMASLLFSCIKGQLVIYVDSQGCYPNFSGYTNVRFS